MSVNKQFSFRAFISEEGFSGVKSILWNSRKKKWVVTYKNKRLTPDEFDFFSEAYQWLKQEGAQE